MKTRFTALLNVFALFCALGFAAAHAQVPKTINYQGYLTTPSGAAVNNANLTMVFKLYDAATGGTVLHTETQMVTVTNGIFNVMLGTSPALTPPFTAQYFLGVTVGTDPEMTPRRPLTSAPYSVAAENIAPGGNLYLSDSTASVGNVFKNGNRFMHNSGLGGTFLGIGAGTLTGGAFDNTGLGVSALGSLGIGQDNTAVGSHAASSQVDAYINTALGSHALFSNVSGNANTAVGTSALANAKSNSNIAIGADAGYDVTTGQHNVLIGNLGVATESFTIRLGDPATHTNTFLSGTVNTANISATGAITTSSMLTAANITTGGNIYLSDSTASVGNVFKNGNRFMHNNGVSNAFLGEGAGNFTLTSQQNTGVGFNALRVVTSGSGNTAQGFEAAKSVDGGGGNTAIGNRALNESVSGLYNTAVGLNALRVATSDGNIGLGAFAGEGLTTGGNNIMIGNPGFAGESNTIRLGNSSHTRTLLPGNVGFHLDAGATPDRPVTIQASGVEWIGLRNSAGANKWHVNHKNGGVNFAETDLADGRLFLAAGGNVGIGTDAPTKAKLEINGFATQALGASYRVNSAGGLAVAASNFNLSVYANNAIAANEFLAFSDQRIKRVSGRSNAARDLSTLAAIEVTDYTHIDTPQRGDKAHKKVIAQQVETIYPQAVNKITDVVPDIYQRAAVKDCWIALEDPTKANLKNGDRVRLIGKATQGVHEVLEVADGRFRTAFKADSDTIFVYGREVNDFRTVDYEAIAMLNVSATQELHRRLDAEAAKVRAQGAEIAQLKQQLAQLSDLNAKVAWLMAQKAPAKP